MRTYSTQNTQSSSLCFSQQCKETLFFKNKVCFFYFFLFFFCFFLHLASVGYAQQKAALRTDNSSVYAGFAKQIQIVTEGFSQNAQIIFPKKKGLLFRQIGGAQQSNFYSNINGKVTSRNEVIFTFEVVAEAAGTYQLNNIVVQSGGLKSVANPVTVRFIQPSQNQEILVTTFTDKSEYFLNERVLLTVRINSIATFLDHRMAFPILNFLEQFKTGIFKFNKGKEANLNVDRYTIPFFVSESQTNNYYVTYETTFELFPNQLGSLKIAPFTIQAILNIQNQNNRQVSVASSKALNINIKEVPTKNQPLNYKNAVGQFSIESFIIGDNYKVGEAIPLTIKIQSNNGIVRENQLINIEELDEFTSLFDISDKEIIDKQKKSIVYSYKIAPKSIQTDKVPSIQFHSFEPHSQSYQTVSTPIIPLNIKKRELLDEDDIFIPDDEIEESKNNQLFSLSEISKKEDHFNFVISMIFPPFLFIVFLLLGFWKRFKTSENRLNQQWVSNQLKAFENELHENQDPIKFISLVSLQIQTLLAKKLNIVSHHFTQSNVKEAQKRGAINNDAGEMIIEIMEKLEVNRFAPINDVALDQSETIQKIKKLYQLLWL